MEPVLTADRFPASAKNLREPDSQDRDQHQSEGIAKCRSGFAKSGPTANAQAFPPHPGNSRNRKAHRMQPAQEIFTPP